MTVMFIFVIIIIVFLFIYNKVFDTNQFIKELSPKLKQLMEKDYEFLLTVRHGDKAVDVKALFEKRIRDAIIMFVVALFGTLLLELNIVLALVISFVIALLIFKLPYIKLKSFYKQRLHTIDLLLPYYLKGLEILVEHYTVPVALSRSIDTAPEVFKKGLLKLVAKIDAGDSSIQPYIDFANEYPVRDSMRMMRLLYRLSLGSQENKQEQVMAFSRMVSTLQNKAREIKYQERLNVMERKTMIMLFATGGGVMALLFMSMTLMI